MLSRASVQALLSDVDLAAGSTAAALPVVRLQAEGRAEPGQSWNLAGRLTLSGGRIQDKVRRLDARGMELDLPLQWPAKEKVPAGRVQLGAMQWEGRRLGGLEGTLQQQGRTIQVRLEHLSKLFEGLRVFMEGSLGAEGFRERPPLTAG